MFAPIPEPQTYAMMLAGLGLMGFVARRRKQEHDYA
ncbi:MAG: PEPxxWA-CTERM sorting domain-containing protein [Burkholderiales bacterium]|nr:PEPxxWA-CTERM sorting domain-containing protein [Burkholderiales bacterium]